jgi:hypothetical protein
LRSVGTTLCRVGTALCRVGAGRHGAGPRSGGFGASRGGSGAACQIGDGGRLSNRIHLERELFGLEQRLTPLAEVLDEFERVLVGIQRGLAPVNAQLGTAADDNVGTGGVLSGVYPLLLMIERGLVPVDDRVLTVGDGLLEVDDLLLPVTLDLELGLSVRITW